MKCRFVAGSVLLLTILLTGLSACTGDASNDPLLTQKQNPAIDSTSDNTRTKAGISEDYTHTNRVIWQKPDMVIDLLGDLSDKTIADIGAGTGFFSLRLTPKAEKVIAIDIDPRFVDYLDSIRYLQLPDPLQNRLETRLGTPADPKLTPGEADIVLIVNTAVYIKDRVAYLANLKKGIGLGGKLLIIDFKKKRTPVGPPQSMKVPAFQIEEELYQAGYSQVTVNDTSLDYQYIIVAVNGGQWAVNGEQ